MREVAEEVGAKACNLEYVTRWKYNHHVPNQGMHIKVFLHAMIAEIDPAHLKLQDSEVQATRLLPPGEVHKALFLHKGLPQIHLAHYEGYYRQLLAAVEERIAHHNWLRPADTIESKIKEENP